MKELPILKHREEIIQAVRNNQVTIIVGPTGSGKTTQIPQFLKEAFPNGQKGKIGITQPRRMAATSVAYYVAGQMNCKIGKEVGYQIRFDDHTTEGTLIKFMTDGILLREIQSDPELSEYKAIMIDEAHERSLNMDFILGLLKDLLKRRKDLKLVVGSATIEEKKFSQYFAGAPVINVSGRMYPVDVRYLNLQNQIFWESSYDKELIKEEVVNVVGEIHNSGAKGDILVFLTGEEDISAIVKEIEEQAFPGLVCFPLYGNMSFEDQMRVFEPINVRKVVVATNIAETSVTIDGIVYVVDAGWVKQKNFYPERGVGSLEIVKISRASAEQRAGRAGRTQPGICYRLYSEESFNDREVYTKPEIQRTDLAGVVLQMRIIGISNVENFDFIDPPDKEMFHAAHETLVTLGALNENNGITFVGRMMVRLPLEPRFGRMVLAAQQYGCMDQVLTIVAALSGVRSLFNRPKGKEEEAKEAHQKFKDRTSDFLTLLKIYQAYLETKDKRTWCRNNFLNMKALENIRDIRRQLQDIVLRVGFPSHQGKPEDLHKAVAAGLVQNICRSLAHYQYARRGKGTIFIHPGSSLSGSFFGNLPPWIVAAEIVQTTKPYARYCCAINPEWIREIAPQLCETIIEVVSFNRDTGKIEVIEHIRYDGEEICQQPAELDVKTFKEEQSRRIAEAEANGWIKLSFIFNIKELDWTAESGGMTYLALSSDIHIETGKTYYCSVKTKEDDVFFKIIKKKFVRIQFEVFDLE